MNIIPFEQDVFMHQLIFAVCRIRRKITRNRRSPFCDGTLYSKVGVEWKLKLPVTSRAAYNKIMQVRTQNVCLEGRGVGGLTLRLHIVHA
jgi:hypothetical protein